MNNLFLRLRLNMAWTGWPLTVLTLAAFLVVNQNGLQSDPMNSVSQADALYVMHSLDHEVQVESISDGITQRSQAIAVRNAALNASQLASANVAQLHSALRAMSRSQTLLNELDSSYVPNSATSQVVCGEVPQSELDELASTSGANYDQTASQVLKDSALALYQASVAEQRFGSSSSVKKLAAKTAGQTRSRLEGL